ncbi:MAG TPA: histidine--tRNA ligase [Candidatus Binatia bacterium]|nr:histidine--tRNA ligase [Candidatus Binatia bacterium]
MSFQAPKGTHDILPGESERWNWLEARLRDILERYGYREVRTPMFESTDLFVRSVGESTDIVRKELYTFEDKGGRSLTLRPEGTAPLVRAYLEHSMGHGQPMARLYYIGAMFRYERPQAGRFRQFAQVGAELLGPGGPAADGEMIDLFVAVMRGVGLEDPTVLLNSLGDSVCRPVYREKIREYFGGRVDELCGDCKERLRTNPLRILDCKVPSCQPVLAGAPRMLDFLCDPCREHFEGVQAALRALSIPFEIAPRLVRGLDYYTRTVFEVHSGSLGAQSAVGGGGRYDLLVEEFGGPSVPALGFSIGLERLLLAAAPAASGMGAPDIAVVARDPSAALGALVLARELRGLGQGASGPTVVADVAGRSAGAQMKWASKMGARYAVFVPADAEGYAVRNMREGTDEPKAKDAAALRAMLAARLAASRAGERVPS